jgi:acyl-coenzyme A synthetase/AMP-(fatty) acid ligase
MTYASHYHRSIEDPEGFWAEQAKVIDWFEAPRQILSQDQDGLHRWFAGGKMNTCHLALDFHVANGRGDQTALIYDSPVTQSFMQYSYRELLHETALLAGALTNLGVKKGDRVIIYMPMVPQVIFAMLACARIGAIHSVVFGGFAAHELALRIDDATPKVLLTASAGVEFNKIIPYKPLVDAAIKEAQHKIDHVVVYQRWMCQAKLTEGELDWTDLVRSAKPVACTVVDATDPLYILYTSGTTGKPKGIVRDNGGHAVALRYSMSQVYHAHPGDVYWAASDVGWVVGHSYIVYAPLITGCTTILYEGKPIRTPDAGAYWRVISDYKVNVMFTAPTGIRAVKKEDPEGLLKEKYDVSSLDHLFLAGERCDAATLQWAQKILKIPVIDHWWQTESGWPMLATPKEHGEFHLVKPGSAGRSVPGFQVHILDPEANVLGHGEEGAVGIKLPMPPGCLPTLWQSPERFKEGYLQAYPGYYFTGDGGYQDETGYTFITGRIDDVINVAGHRLSTADMEEIVSAHPAVAECAVLGVADELKGQVPLGFVVLKTDEQISETQLESELVAMVREKLGALACFKKALVVKRLPKTRSGKILRRIMRCIADNQPYQTPSTIEDVTVLDEIAETCITFKHIGS